MNTLFKELFVYNHHCNQQLTSAFLELDHVLPEKASLLYSHILNAHHIWNCRIQLQEPALGVWDKHPSKAFAGLDTGNYETSLRLLEEYDLNQVVHYTTSKGDPFKNTIRDILFHIINHSTYHRGQIATQFKQNGVDPLITDYIFYKR
jgi:uncharacterized damage-inducible protein DinB